MQTSEDSIKFDLWKHRLCVSQHIDQTCVRASGKNHLPLVLHMNRDESLIENQRVWLPTLPITRATNVTRQSGFIRSATWNFPAEIKRAVCNKLGLFSVDDLRARLG